MWYNKHKLKQSLGGTKNECKYYRDDWSKVQSREYS